ncbi:MAG: hypothetical protein PHF00_07030, partial [Elusimicrobia bacterium]|nr:hypothetical protein [Elusimicrobiota bacterium]
LPRMGFYIDDWAFLRPLVFSPRRGWLDLMSAFNVDGYWMFRPLDVVYFTGLYLLGGLSPWKYHAAMMLMEAAAAFFLYKAIRRATKDVGLAFLAALLFLLYPNHAATHHWFAATFTPAMLLFAAGLERYLAWDEEGRKGPLAAGLALFCSAVMIYEAVIPLVLAMPMLGFFRRVSAGEAQRIALRQALLRWLPLAAGAALLVLGQQVLVRRLFAAGMKRDLIWDPALLLQVWGRGLECTSTAILHLAWTSVLAALAFGWRTWLLIAAAAAAGTALLAPALSQARRPFENRHGRLWLLGCAGLLLAAYAPYGFSADRYIPHIFDEQNRINAPGSLAAAMALAWFLRAGFGRASRLSAAALSLLLALFSICNWTAAWQWAESASLQERILSGVSTHAPAGPALAVLKSPPSAGPVAVFNAGFYFDAALQVRTGRRDLHGMLEGEPVPPGAAELPRYDWRWPDGTR